MGGQFAAELKYAGYDAIGIEGKADKPVYLWIDDDQVELRQAKHLWGKTTWEADRMIREELGDPEIKVAAIGPAGERLVRFSCIMRVLGTSIFCGTNSICSRPQRETTIVMEKIVRSRSWRRLSLSLSRGLAKYTKSAPDPVPSRAKEMARKEWLAKRTTEKTLVKRTSRPRVTAETTKRMSRFIFHPIMSY